MRATLLGVSCMAVIAVLPVSTGRANPAHDRLAAMSELNRSELLAVFVESSGHACRTVARTFYQGEDSKGNVFWNVECGDGEAYVVQIKNDVPGSTTVINCRRLRAVGGSACFKKLG